MKTFTDFRIDTRGHSSGSIKTLCPQCSHNRKKTKDPCLSVDISQGVWNCHNCEWKGSLSNGNGNGNGNHRPIPKAHKKPKYEPQNSLSEKVIAWFKDRGITNDVLERNHIGEGQEYMPQVEQKVNTIQFPYLKNGETVNVKFRDANKNFKMVKDAERILYGYDDIEGDALIWVEGEMDKLSIEVAGINSCVSVPNGAGDKLDFLESCKEKLDPINTHIIAVDNDEPGKNLKDELIRRLGPEKCKIVSWPNDTKDANEVLVKLCKEKLEECIKKAKPCPIQGLFEVSDIVDDIFNFYEEGARGGLEVQWPSMRKHYSIRPGEWSLVTGIPSHGKSEFVDALMIGLAETHGWKFGVCSPENQPLSQHAAKLIEKHSRKPFRPGIRERINSKDLIPSIGWLDEHFSFILPDENDLTVGGVLKLAKALVFRKGIRGLVIDPWNELDHSRPSNLSETEYISQSLTKIRRFARTYGVHIWLIAHPTKLNKNTDGKYPVPTPYDVSGSAHWRNKADNCLTVWRDLSQPDSRIVQIHIQKIRFKEVGKIGKVDLVYDYPTGRYFDKENP